MNTTRVSIPPVAPIRTVGGLDHVRIIVALPHTRVTDHAVSVEHRTTHRRDTRRAHDILLAGAYIVSARLGDVR